MTGLSHEAATGLELRVRRVASAPTVAVRLLLRGGARCEPRPGLAWMAGRMLSEGTGRRRWDELAQAVEARGASFATYGGQESLGVAVDALAEDWREALDWAFDAIADPIFPQDRLDLVRLQGSSELRSQLDQPEVRAAWAFRAQLYGREHPRGRPLQGDEASLGAIDPAAAAAFHASCRRAGLLVVVAGDCDHHAVAAKVAELGSAFSSVANEIGVAVPEPVSGTARVEVALPGAEQATLLLGHLTVARNHPDRRALELASVVLGAGAGLSGRIPQRIREDEGLAYVAQATLVAGAGLDLGRAQVLVGTDPEQLEQAEAAAREELERFAAEGPTADEVEEARAYLLGHDVLRRETARQLASIEADGAFYGEPTDHDHVRRELLALDRDAVAEVVRRHLRPESLLVTWGVPS
jgi:zinc protease